MEFADWGRADELLAQHVEQMRAQLRASDMPVFTLTAASRPAPERFGGIEHSGDVLVVVHLVYGSSTPAGPWAGVETARRSGIREDATPLRMTLEHHVRLGGDRFAELTWAESEDTLLVDGQSVTARRLRAGDRWWVLRGSRSGVEITVVGHDWHPAAVAVETLPNPASIVQVRRLEAGTSGRRRGDRQPVPAGEPHRLLADAVLRSSAGRATWFAEGGAAPELPAYWTELWRAAVARQMDLAGQAEPEATAAVRGMTSHLASLLHNTEWFGADERLRGRAIAEVLLYTTGLGPRVASRAAQEAWQRQLDLQGERTRAGRADPQAHVTADEEWRRAWAAWAATQRRP